MSYEHFRKTRDELGRPAEFLSVAMYRSYGLNAEVNDAPEEDYDARASHDIVVEGELHDVKTDYWYRRTKRIFVERKSLEHTKSDWFDYWILTHYGFDIRVFTRRQLIDYYNAQLRFQKADGTYGYRYEYEHAVAGDQEDNDGVFVPMEVVRRDGLAPWQFAKQLREVRQAA